MSDIGSLFEIFNSENQKEKLYPLEFLLPTSTTNFEPCLINVISYMYSNEILLEMKNIIWEKYFYSDDSLCSSHSLKVFSRMYGGFLSKTDNGSYIEYRIILEINSTERKNSIKSQIANSSLYEGMISIETEDDVRSSYENKFMELTRDNEIYPKKYSYRKIGDFTKVAK